MITQQHNTTQEVWTNCCMIRMRSYPMNRNLNWFEELHWECIIFTNTILFIVISLHETFYWQEVENPKSLYFDWFCVSLSLSHIESLSFVFWVVSSLFLFTSLQLILSHMFTHTLICCVLCWTYTHTHLGFWNVTNSWENRWRKGNNTTHFTSSQHNTHIYFVSIETNMSEMSVVWFWIFNIDNENELIW
jgi:hypothetical protein